MRSHKILTTKGRPAYKRTKLTPTQKKLGYQLIPPDKPIRGWHCSSGRLAYQEKPIPVRAGTTYIYNGKKSPLLCERGLHLSRELYDVLHHLHIEYDTIISRVEAWGLVEEGHDKLVASHRRVLWSVKLPDLQGKDWLKSIQASIRKAGRSIR